MMKILTLSFFLFLGACVSESVADVEAEMNEDAIVHFYTEYEGTASMSADLNSVVISSSDQPERE